MAIGGYNRLPPLERFQKKIFINKNGCWEWGNVAGYAQFKVDGKYVLAHRWSYEHHIGAIPDKFVIDHLCRNIRCVNPHHLEAVTMKTNTERGVLYETLTANAKKKTHCKRGHPLFGKNLGRDSRGHRKCLVCMAMLVKKWKEANRERVNHLQRIRRSKGSTK